MTRLYACSLPGCPTLSPKPGRCVEHERERRRAVERERPSKQERGYDAAWQRARARYLREHPVCE
jgi:5-methylcytosine-specific restriction protein A